MNQITEQDIANVLGNYHYTYNLGSVCKMRNTIMGDGLTEQQGTLHHPVIGGWMIVLQNGGISRMKEEGWLPKNGWTSPLDISSPKNLEQTVATYFKEGVVIAEPGTGLAYRFRKITPPQQVNDWDESVYTSMVPKDYKIFNHGGDITREDLGSKTQSAIEVAKLLPYCSTVFVMSQTAHGPLGIGTYGALDRDGLLFNMGFVGTKKNPKGYINMYVNGPRAQAIKTDYVPGMQIPYKTREPVATPSIAVPYAA